MNTSRVKLRVLVSSVLLAAMSIGAVMQQPGAPPPPAGGGSRLRPAEIKIYGHHQSLIDWTPRQIQDCPYLHKLQWTGSQDKLLMVLQRVGQTGTLLFQDLPRLSCDEDVISETGREVVGATFGSLNHVPAVNSHKFRYIVIARPAGDFPYCEEYRTDVKGNPIRVFDLTDFVMITSGFASSWLYLSPADQLDNRFLYFGTEAIRNRECHVVGFAQEPEKARRFSEFTNQGYTYDLLLQGLAWIDSENFQVLRMVTWLLAPRTDIGLTSQATTVEFYPVKPSGSERVLWLPRDVKVDMVSQGAAVHNTHHYSNFKLFRVESRIIP